MYRIFIRTLTCQLHVDLIDGANNRCKQEIVGHHDVLRSTEIFIEM